MTEYLIEALKSILSDSGEGTAADIFPVRFRQSALRLGAVVPIRKPNPVYLPPDIGQEVKIILPEHLYTGHTGVVLENRHGRYLIQITSRGCLAANKNPGGIPLIILPLGAFTYECHKTRPGQTQT